uniref:Uncharacterized protein n=1 Tax=Triticum urartu TaxID=4572 RepID=A0A8R7K1W6_TRIUA
MLSPDGKREHGEEEAELSGACTKVPVQFLDTCSVCNG